MGARLITQGVLGGRLPQAGPVVWRITADYGFTTPSIDAVELVVCPGGIEIIQGLAVEILESNDVSI